MATTDPTKKLVQDLARSSLERLFKGVVKISEPLLDAKEKKEKEEKEAEKVKKGLPKFPKKELVASIIKEIERIGVKRMADAINITTAQEICTTLGVNFEDKEYKSGQANKGRKNVISKRLSKHVASKGLEEVLTLLEDEQQKAVLEALELPEAAGTNRAIATRISAEVRRIGAEVVLSKMDLTFLKDLGEELSLDVHDISSQATVIKAILTGKVPAKRTRPEKKQEPISKKKPKLEAGISIADMMQHYNLSELQEFARDHTDDSVKISGKKKDLMKRLHDYFEGNEPATKKAKKEVKKEETPAAKKEKTPAKKADKKEKPAKEAEKEKEEEEEEAEAEPEVPKEKEKSPKKAAAKKETGKAKPKKQEAAEEAEEEEKEAEEAPKEKEATPKKGKKAETTTSKKGKSEKVTGER